MQNRHNRFLHSVEVFDLQSKTWSILAPNTRCLPPCSRFALSTLRNLHFTCCCGSVHWTPRPESGPCPAAGCATTRT
ncbi:hypothetical protein [Mycolicibacterium rhodesiae]|uniref:hypothetical protein n=1 Tax=Mycolicibacterium rhodesiae TaxID=36814 RepID=UPI003466BA3E